MTISQEISNEIRTFEETIGKLNRGEISMEKFRQFRLRFGVYGQRQPDVQMIRVKIPWGHLTAPQMDALADIIEEYSSGIGHITTRQDIQFHFVKLANVPTVLRKLAEADLTTREACGNCVRNVTSCYLSGTCKDEAFDITSPAETVTRYLLRHNLTQELPRKFKISFSGCVGACGLTAINDFGVTAKVRETNGKKEYGFNIRVGGGLGATPRLNQLLFDFVPLDELLPACEAVIRVFDRYGERKNRSKARMKFLIDKIGIDEFRKRVLGEIDFLKAAGRVYPNIDIKPQITYQEQPASELSVTSDTDFEKWKRTNVLSQKQAGLYSAYITLPRGDLDSAQFRAIAKIMKTHGIQEIRTTLIQNFLFLGIPGNKLKPIYDDLKKAGLHEPGAETITDIISCPGADTCNLGITSSRGLAKAIRESLLKQNGNLEKVKDFRINISGCPNSCGQHHIADIGFYGMAKNIEKNTVPYYQMLLGGDVRTDSPELARSVIRLPAKNIPNAVTRVVNYYTENRQSDESFGAFSKRVGYPKWAEVLKEYENIPQDKLTLEYNHDWFQEDVFKIKVGQGECAGVTLEQVEEQFNESQQFHHFSQLEFNKQRWADVLYFTFKSLIAAAKGLLLADGFEPRNDQEIIDAFTQRFSGKNEPAKELAVALKELTDTPSQINQETLHAIIQQTEKFLSDSREYYKTMDKLIFNLPTL